jgi:hypothetical protein
MKVLIAGATGVLGRATVPRLVSAGHEVVGVARSDLEAAQLRSQGAEPLPLDLFDPRAAKAALQDQDAVIHMATSIPTLSRAISAGAWAENDRLRRDATKVLTDAARSVGVPVFVKETVCFFYPGRGDEWIDEDTPVERSAFSAASLDAEDMVNRFTGPAAASDRCSAPLMPISRRSMSMTPRRQSSQDSTRPPAPTTRRTNRSSNRSGTRPSHPHSGSSDACDRPRGSSSVWRAPKATSSAQVAACRPGASGARPVGHQRTPMPVLGYVRLPLRTGRTRVRPERLPPSCLLVRSAQTSAHGISP